MDNVIYKIHSQMDNLTKAQKRLANELLSNTEQAIYYSTDELAEICDVSKAAISRFCYLFDYYGLKDLQISLARELSLTNEQVFINPDSKEFSENIAENVLGQMKIALTDTYKKLNAKAVEKTAQLILNARSVYLAGIGASGIVAQDLLHKLFRLQIEAKYHQEYDLMRVAMMQATPEDVLVAISYSGKKHEILTIVNEARKLNVPVIVITCSKDNELAKQADILLEVAALEKAFRSSAFTSRIVQLYVVDVVFHTCCAYLGTDKMEKLQKTYNIIQNEHKEKFEA